MKLSPLSGRLTVMLLLGAMLAACGTAPATRQPGAEKLSVSYVDWKKFSDIKDRFDWTEEGELAILKEIEASLQQDARVYVPDGDHLSMTITDIHLAGAYQPSLSRRRIINATFPPRAVFSYALTNSAGQTVKSGQVDLTDANFQTHLSMNRDDPLHYEKDMLNTWMQGMQQTLRAN